MSDTEKLENPINGQNVNSDSTVEPNSDLNTNEKNLNESQDFQLIMDDGSIDFNKMSSDLLKVDEEVSREPLIKDINCEVSDLTAVEDSKQTISNDKACSDNESKDVINIELNVKSSIGVSNDQSNDKLIDEEKEVIEATQQSSEMSNSNISDNQSVGQVSCKRKADSTDGPHAKYQKLSTENEVPSICPNDLDSLNETKNVANETEIDNPVDPVIVAETQFLEPEDLKEDTTPQIIEETQDVMDIDSTKNIDSSTICKESEVSKEEEKENSTEKNITNGQNENEDSLVDCNISKDECFNNTLVEAVDSGLDVSVKTLKEKNDNESSQLVDTATDNNIKLSNISESKIVESSTEQDSVECLKIEGKSSNNETVELKNPNTIEDEKKNTVKSKSTNNSRMSVEVIYDAVTSKESKKPREFVEIDEDGEKIVLDSSQEILDSTEKSEVNIDSTNINKTYKNNISINSNNDSSCKLTKNTKDDNLFNGKDDSKNIDIDCMKSNSENIPDTSLDNLKVDNLLIEHKVILSSKDNDSLNIISVSDNEADISKNKFPDDNGFVTDTSIVKSVAVEKEFGFFVKLKCMLQIDEVTKDCLSKEIVSAHCESKLESLAKQKNSDTSASLADISGNDNKESSPGSVNSNPHPFSLNPSRFSLVSTISSSSSASSAASLAAKMASKDTNFSLPHGPAKHAKKHIEISQHSEKFDESCEKLCKEWKNYQLVITKLFNCMNTELNVVDLNNEPLDEQLNTSTPKVTGKIEMSTPKTGKKTKGVKRSRNKSTISRKKSSTALSNVDTIDYKNATSNNETQKINHVENIGILEDNIDQFVGKEVFAKWTDKNYYPGKVVEKMKTKYKVHFHDGQNKVLIDEFIIPVPPVLSVGLSIYALSQDNDYGSCGIITDTKNVDGKVHYVVETDDQEKLEVKLSDIFLSPDQADLLREEMAKNQSFLSTPKQQQNQVTMDNIIEGKRRSKRIGTPVFSTPKVKRRMKSFDEPSGSGLNTKNSNDDKRVSGFAETSDSAASVVDEPTLIGIHPEIIGTPNEQYVKGPKDRMKGSSNRSKSSIDEGRLATILGPIPLAGSDFFKGMSFILTCVSLDDIDRHLSDNKDSSSELETDNEEEWLEKPFVRERLERQIKQAGGIVYEKFELIPESEYANTNLITNIPNNTAKSLLCLSVGIPAFNHKWIIRCCEENKLVNSAENGLPAGWSYDKRCYIENFQRVSKKPLTQLIVMIPNEPSYKEFASFWRKICENAGAVVILVENTENMEGFADGSVVLANSKCPSWVIKKATNLQIPVLSTIWLIQCLICGDICPHETQPSYVYNYKKT